MPRPRIFGPLALCLVFVLGAAGDAFAAPASGARDHLVVGLNAYRDGFHDLAAKELSAYLDANPPNERRAQVLDLLSRSQIALERWQAAQTSLRTLVSLESPQAVEARYRLGWVLARQGRPVEALAALDAYLAEKAPAQRVDALWLAAAQASEVGEPTAAAERFAAFLTRAKGDARRPVGWEHRVALLAEAGDLPGAVAATKKALADPSVGRDVVVAERLISLGIGAARKGGDAPAEAELRARLARLPGDREVERCEAGAAYLRADDPARARKWLEACLAGKPNGPNSQQAHLLLAEVARRQDRPEEALDHLEAALGRPGGIGGRRPALEEAAFSLALEVGDRKRAERHARVVVSGGPRVSPETATAARFLLAEVAVDAGRRDRAVAHWVAVPASSPRYREARLAAARVRVEQGRFPEALDLLSDLLGTPDPDGAAHLTALAAAEGAGLHRRAADLSGWLAEHPPPGTEALSFRRRQAGHLGRAGDTEAYTGALERLAEPSVDVEIAAWAAGELQRLAFEREDLPAVLHWGAGADGTDRGVLFRNAGALAGTGRPDEAAALWERLAGAEGPYRGPSLVQLGLRAETHGDVAAARARYEAAIAAGLPDEAAAWVRTRLEQMGQGTGDGDP